MNAIEKTRTTRGNEEAGESLDPLVTDLLHGGSDILNTAALESGSIAAPVSDGLRKALDALGPDLGRQVLARAHAGDYPPDVEEAVHGESTLSTVHHELKTMSEQTGERAARTDHPSQAVTIQRLSKKYRKMLAKQRIGRAQGYALRKLLGRGGQGKVFLTKRRGADEFGFVAAIKLFSPEPYPTIANYETAMRRIARVASLVAQAHHPNLVDVLFFDRCCGVRMMLMELVDGFDLRRLIRPRMHEKLQERAPEYLWEEINKDLVTLGRRQLRMRPGFAVAIVRDCLAGLTLLHRRRVVHGDIKPSNIMLDRISGHAKLVDLGSAFDLDDTFGQRFLTPAYAAPEVLERRQWTPQSDLASLGYVLIELLIGQRLFAGAKTSLTSEQTEPLGKEELLRKKKDLPHYLEKLVSMDVRECRSLMGLCRKLTDPDPDKRFVSAEHADLDPKCGAYVFQQQLIKGNLAREYGRGIRDWIEALK